jgi:hypothetical protein
MSLFRNKATPQTEPEPALEPEPQPDALALATTEEAAAAEATRAAAARCATLDAEQKSWSARRDAAYRAFVDSLERHADAKQKIAAISKPAADAPVLFATGAVSPHQLGEN